MRTCPVCSKGFEPTYSSMQQVCGPTCAGKKVRSDKADKKRADALERKQDKAKREAMKTWPELNAEVQEAFNAFIRARDAGLDCVCCGRPMGAQRFGGAVDAGHFRSRGTAPQLRFHEDNCHAQRKQCNRDDSGNYLGFRLGLIARIGLARVEALEADNTVSHYSKDDLRAIKALYQRKARELKKARE